MLDAPSTTPAAPATPALLPLPASLRSIPVLAGTVALAVAVSLLQGSLSTAVLRAVLVFVLVPCALIDLDRRIIPNRITGPATLIAIVLGLVLDPGGELRRVAWAAGCGGFLLVAALAYPAGMGMGDVKLVAVMGLLLGPAVLVALFAALTANALVGLALMARHGVRAGRRTSLPFGPFLAGGGLLAALVGSQLLSAYLSLHH
jgi:leader peptidase (prepilin peptidase) / N-methyltransferase